MKPDKSNGKNNGKNHGKKLTIEPSMTVLDVVAANGAALEIFTYYDLIAGECICCNSLFCSLENMAAKYGIDLEELLRELRKA